MRRAFEKRKAEIRAVPRKSYVPLNLNVQRAVSVVLSSSERLRRVRPHIEAITTVGLVRYDALEEYALALAHADVVLRVRYSPPWLADATPRHPRGPRPGGGVGRAHDRGRRALTSQGAAVAGRGRSARGVHAVQGSVRSTRAQSSSISSCSRSTSG